MTVGEGRIRGSKGIHSSEVKKELEWGLKRRMDHIRPGRSCPVMPSYAKPTNLSMRHAKTWCPSRCHPIPASRTISLMPSNSALTSRPHYHYHLFLVFHQYLPFCYPCIQITISSSFLSCERSVFSHLCSIAISRETVEFA